MLKRLLQLIYSKIKANLFVFALFLMSTVFFIALHWYYWSWDWTVYILNAQYWFSNGIYFELLRPPLTSFLMGLFHYAGGWKAAELLYLIFCSALFAFSSVKVADWLKIDRKLFYALELSPFVLLFGLFSGTELLALALLQLGLAALSKPRTGLLFGLATLTRYNFLFYAPMLLLRKKKILSRLVLFALPLLAWFGFNWLAYGSPWASLAETYSLNITHAHQSGSVLLSILLAIGWYLPFVIMGLCNTKEISKKSLALIAIFTVLTFFSYFKVPNKEMRYLFNFALPIAVLASLSLKKFASSKKVLAAIVITNVVLACVIGAAFPLEDPNSALKPRFEQISTEVDCGCVSNLWVIFDWVGKPCMVAPGNEQTFDNYIEQGYRIVLFKEQPEPLYINNASFIESHKELILENTTKYFVFGNLSACITQDKVQHSVYPELGMSKPDACRSLWPDSLCNLSDTILSKF